jgi:sugar lactone lactonase YvrE
MTGPWGRLGLTLGVVAVAAGCALPSGILKGTLAQETVTTARSTALGLTTLSGAVLGPLPGLIADNAASVLSNNAGGLIANNSAGLVSNNGGGVAANHGGSYRVRHVADLTVPAAGATLTVVDAQGRLLTTRPAKTDKDGRYKLTGLTAASGVVFLKATYQLEGHEVTLVAPVVVASGAAQNVAVNPATTLVAQKLAARLKQGDERPESVRQSALEAASRAIAEAMSPRAVVAAAILPADKAAETYDHMLAESPALAQAVQGAQRVAASAGPAPTARPSSEPSSPPAIQASKAPSTAPAPTAAPAPRPNGGVVNTWAGSGAAGDADGTGTAAEFDSPVGLAMDRAGNLFVADQGNHRIRKIAPDGVVSTFAGTGDAGAKNGDRLSATFRHPEGLAFDAAGNLFVADRDNHRIRKIAPDGAVTTFAGDGQARYREGIGIAASFNEPTSLAFDAAGALIVCDSHNHRLRKVAPDGTTALVAGSGQEATTDGVGGLAAFSHPTSLCRDAAGNVYAVEEASGRVRKVAPDGTVTTLPGTFDFPTGVTVDANGVVYVAEQGGNRISRIAPDGTVSVLAGGGDVDHADGTGTAAAFNSLHGLVVYSENRLYVADMENNRIRRVE